MHCDKLKITVEIARGADITTACGQVKELSEFLGRPVEFRFNGVSLAASDKLSINDMASYYSHQR